MRQCLDYKARWWEVLNDNTHISKGYGECAEGHNLYAEKDNGEFVLFGNDPIKESSWDFSRLPDSEIATVKELLQMNDVKGLMAIHNKYKLTNRTLCCDGEGVVDNFMILINFIS